MSYMPPTTRAPPQQAWEIPFDKEDPKMAVSLPGVVDTIKLLPLARRVGRKEARGTIIRTESIYISFY